MDYTLQWTACDKATNVLAELGRTEDLMFSPSGRRLALAGFRANRIAIFEIGIDTAANGYRVRLTDVVEIVAPTLNEPHGLCFLDEHTLVVANRLGDVETFVAPAPCATKTRHHVSARQKFGDGSSRLIHTPGSVAAYPLDRHTVELLVCNNYINTVSRHTLDRRRCYEATSDAVHLAHRLDCPDGISVCPDGTWIAVSNHNTHSVLLYDRSRALHSDTEPDGILYNVLCPHGVRFTPDLEHILVADAGAPYINVYKRNGTSWKGRRDPTSLFRVMNDTVFGQGRHNPQEGGPKGMDIDPRGRVLAVTCESQPLAFFDLSNVVSSHCAPAHRHLPQLRQMKWRIEAAVFNKLGYISRKTA